MSYSNFRIKERFSLKYEHIAERERPYAEAEVWRSSAGLETRWQERDSNDINDVSEPG